MADKIKGIPVAPLTGVLDVRSDPNQMPANSLRMRQNCQTTAQGKLARGTGWQKFLSSSNYNNADFHDQLLTFTDSGIRQPPTLLFNAKSTQGVSSLFLGTQTKIALLNEFSGNYRILGDGFGGTPSTSAAARRFYAAQEGNVVAFTNDFNPPMYHVLEGTTAEGAPALNTFDDLEVIGLTRAGVIWSWRGCVFLADVEMDKERFSYRLVWSDYQGPTSFDPAKLQSITGFKDLYTHERILGGRPFGTSFLIYTTHGIWEMVVVGGDKSFDFARRYNGEDAEGATVLKYPGTLVSVAGGENLPASHVYGAEDGIYIFNQYFTKPQRVEWLHRATPIIYDDIDITNCKVHIAAVRGTEVLISTASKSAVNNCPDRTLRINLAYNVADKIDAGFIALATYESQSVPTIRDFIISNGICSLAGLIAAGYPYADEGLPAPVPTSTAPFAPQSFYTSTPQTVDGVVTEDWTRPAADSDSLCALLAGQSVDDICRKCEGPVLLVGASSQDWCLKQLGIVFYRERCANPSAVGSTSASGYASAAGQYLLDGIDSILRFAPMYIGKPVIQLDTVRLDYLARVNCQIGLRIGIAAQVADPNTDVCDIVWFQHSLQDLKCLSHKTAAQHKAGNTVPSVPTRWSLYRVGHVICAELKISGTGGDVDLCGIVAEVSQQERRDY